MAGKKNGSLRDLQRTTDLLSGLLTQEAKALNERRKAEGAGEITAVLKDLAAVARSLGEQSGGESGEYGVVLLPPAGGKEEER